MRYFRFLAVLAILVNTQLHLNAMVWEKLTRKDQGSIYIVQHRSNSDFWISSKKKLWHYKEEEWIQYPEIKTANITSSLYIVENDEPLMVLSTDPQYHTSINIWDGNSFKKSDKVIPVPIKGMVSNDTQNILYGDWGNLFEIHNTDLIPLENPIENHILTAQLHNGKVFFGCRKEGIYAYQHNEFVNIPIDDYDGSDISSLQSIGDSLLFAMTGAGLIYELKGDSFQLYDDHFKGEAWFFINKNSAQEPIVIGDEGLIYQRDDGKWKKEFIPGYATVRQLHFNEAGQGLMLNLDGEVFVSRENHDSELLFYEKSREFHIDGSIYESSTGAAFLFYDDDDYLDLFVQNDGKNRKNYLYIRNNEEHFTDIAQSKNISKTHKRTLFTLGDINKDGLVDILFSYGEGGKQIFSYFAQKKEGDFFEKSRFTFPDSILFSLRDMDWLPNSKPQIALSYFYSEGRNRGFLAGIEYSNIFQKPALDIKYKNISRGWIQSFVPGQLGDQKYFFISNFWNNDIILYPNMADSMILIGDPEITANVFASLLIDFDNDGDLDLIQNDRKNVISVFDFKDKTFIHNIEKENYLREELGNEYILHLNSADFNNDSYRDLLISTENQNYIFLNKDGMYFLNKTTDSQLQKPAFIKSVFADIDRDGDIDIYGLRNETNVLWLNQHNQRDFIQIKTWDVKSGYLGLGVSVKLYDAGFVGDKEHLKSYSVCGSDNSIHSTYNSPIFHFGVDKESYYDAEIIFNSGKKKYLTNIGAGSRIEVRERSKFLNFLLLLPKKILRVLLDTSFYMFLLFFSIMVFILNWAIRSGIKNFYWPQNYVFFLILLSLTVFWGTLFQYRQMVGIYKFVLPNILSVVIIGIFYLASYQMSKVKRHFNPLKSKEELLKTLMIFSHGEWAMSGLNSLILFCQNIENGASLSSGVKKNLKQRADNYLNLVSKSILDIVEKASLLQMKKNTINKLSESHKIIVPYLESEALLIQPENAALVARELQSMKKNISLVKAELFIEYSSVLISVFRDVLNIWELKLQQENIRVHLERKVSSDQVVLIKTSELADVIDNLLQNAVKAFRQKESKDIYISVYKIGPKVYIDVKDTGMGISEDRRETIFENGFSGFGGTGKGLFLVKDLLSKYGGRIYVKDSRIGECTIFTIELNEGLLTDENKK